MKLTIEHTGTMAVLNGTTCRIWEGETESGVRVHVLVASVAVRDDRDQTQFERELREASAPASTDAQWAFGVRPCNNVQCHLTGAHTDACERASARWARIIRRTGSSDETSGDA